MIISHIVAIAKNKVIGVNNTLPWHIPEDLKYFREKTKGHIIIMGRKTFESFPKPLPNRLHIVITSQPQTKNIDHPLVKFCTSIEDALQVARENLNNWPEEVFIIGGSRVFKESFPYTNKLYLTLIDKEFDGDILYPDLPEGEFQMIEKKSAQDSTQPSLSFAFSLWERKSAINSIHE